MIEVFEIFKGQDLFFLQLHLHELPVLTSHTFSPLPQTTEKQGTF